MLNINFPVMLAPTFSWASSRGFFLSLLIGVSAFAQENKPAESPSEAELAIKRFKLADGFKAELFASEPLFANPVSFTFDQHGRAYVVETYRVKEGTYDIREHMNWLDEELASTTLEDHYLKIKNHLSDVSSWTNASERISLLEDTDGDGKADKSTVFATGFNDPADGIAAGVLVHKGDVYFTCIPDLYLLRDTNGDGKADIRKSLQRGYGVRFGFLGHDLHGLIIGPDGRLYFSIGDRGLNVKQGDRDISFPEGGAVLRCDLDGSNLEIYSYGLRNPQELAFDKYGDLFTGDNNSDAGDKARWVYLVEGSDNGWRVGFQFIEHPNPRGPWNADGMWDPERAPRVAYIVPPLANIAAGPSGLAYYPGVGMSEKYNDHFFLCDFRGSPSSEIHSFAVQPKGASFEVIDHQQLMTGPLVTDVGFGPDSALYVSDWVHGWGMTGKGRIYKLVNPALETPLVAETKKLINEGLEHKSTAELTQLLAHADQRVRQEAQFTLAKQGASAIKTFVEVAQGSTNQLARLHAIWGLGQIARQESQRSNPTIFDPLVKLLSDSDIEVSGNAARILGEAKYAKAYDGLIALLQNVKAPRGQFFAAMALGKLGDKKAAQPIIEMLRANDDKDAFLRHAGIMGLLWLNDYDAVLNAAKDTSPSVRLAAVVAMRRLHRADVSMFLTDKHQNVVVEAARAINDLPIIQSLPDLARLIEQPNYDEPLFRRVLNANFRLGTPENAVALAKLAARAEAPEPMRVEALEMLTDWAKPSSRDRVTGLWRPIAERDGKDAQTALSSSLAEIIRSAPDSVKLAAIHFAEKFGVKESAAVLFDVLNRKEITASVRAEALKALAKLEGDKLSEAVEIAAKDEAEELRKEAVTLQAKLKPSDAAAPLLKALAQGSTGEKQSALAALGNLKDDAADKILADWMDKLIAGQVPDELKLDLIEAAEKHPSVKEKLEKFDASRTRDDIGPFRECLAGGNAEEGRKVFFERVEASCNRCHKANGEGGEVGPVLNGVGAKRGREYVLQSIVNPNAEIAPGFESVMVTLKNGQAYAGTLKSEDKKDLVINSPEDGIVRVPKKDVASRERGMSGMPPELVKVLSKQDLRNVVEFVSGLK